MQAINDGFSSPSACSGGAQLGRPWYEPGPLHIELLRMLLASRGRLGLMTADNLWNTSLAVGLSTGLDALQAMMTSLTSAGHSSGTLQEVKHLLVLLLISFYR